jgi:hypothetical protein
LSIRDSRSKSYRKIIALLLLGLMVPAIPSILKSSTSSASTESGISLVLSSAPPVLPADDGTYSALVLQFENLTTKLPFVPTSNVQVFLTSSGPQDGTVPPEITYPAGSPYMTANFTTTTLPGNTTISAVAEGYNPASLNIQTEAVGGMPTALQVFMVPSVILPDETLTSNVIVQAVDAVGNPVKLGQSLTVSLSSSNPQIGNVPSSLTIPAGQSFAAATFSPTYYGGQTVIAASAQNFPLASAVMTTVGPTARRLVVSVAPALIADSGDTATVAVQLQDINGSTPAHAPTPVSVVLTSSNSSVAQIKSSTLVIPAGDSYATASIQSGGQAGSANITASAQGYLKGSAILSAQSPLPGPTQLQVYFAPQTLLPDDSRYSQAAVAELQTVSNGVVYPATSTSNVEVYGRSSDNTTMQVSTNAATIPSGSTHAALDIIST